MKKIFTLLVSVLAGLSVSAQTVNLHFKNGTTINFHEDLLESIDFSEKTPEPTLTSGEAVDLGLSVMWASCNLGAKTQTEVGSKYAWGETQTKSSYSKSNYAYYNSSTMTYTNIGKDIAGSEYDAAAVNLGKGWRMPTKAQMYELYSKCTWKWTQINGVNGYMVTGPNKNSIFLPHGNDTYSTFWTSTFYESRNSNAYYAVFSSDGYSLMDASGSNYRYAGYSIRPVISYDDYNGTTGSDDSAVTSKVSAYYAGGSIMSNGGTILSGSKLNFYFKNGSSEDVLLTGIQIVDGNGNEGNNMLSSDVTVAAGESNGYTITLGKNMTSPICRFTYRYNNHTYTVDAAYQSFNMARGMMRELKAE